jgi:hypothetical protein
VIFTHGSSPDFQHPFKGWLPYGKHDAAKHTVAETHTHNPIRKRHHCHKRNAEVGTQVHGAIKNSSRFVAPDHLGEQWAIEKSIVLNAQVSAIGWVQYFLLCRCLVSSVR